MSEKENASPDAKPNTEGWAEIAQIIWNYKEEAEYASRTRRVQNRENYDAYHLRQDYSHKVKGQSMEFLPKQPMAVGQLTSFLQQGLMDQGDWFRIENEDGVTDPADQAPDQPTAASPDALLIKAKEMEKLLLRQTQKNRFSEFVQDGLTLSCLGSLMVAKVGGKHISSPTYFTEDVENEVGKKRLKKKTKEVWQLELGLLRQEDWFPDPSGRKLYEIQRIEMDYHELLKMAKKHPAYFDLEAVKRIQGSQDDLQKAKKSRETNQNVTFSTFRKIVTIYECWGTFIQPFTGEILFENHVAAIDLNGNVIIPPRPNPNWHEESPFVVGYLQHVPHSVWHKALMDAPTRLGTALNELYNLMLDDAMTSVYGIKQIRINWLKNPAQVSDGIRPGMALQVNNACPTGGKVVERLDTGGMSQEAIQLFNMSDREFQQSALTNDTRMGSLAQRAVKATEVVASNQTITGVLNGVVKLIEENWVSKILEKSWMTMAQNMNDLDSNDVSALIGVERAKILANTPNEELFARTAVGKKYKVFGLSQTLNKIQDFRKIQALLQSIGSSPMMIQEFTRDYSITRLLGEIVKSLDIDEDKIKMTAQEQAQRMAEMKMQAEAQAQAQNAKGNTQGGRGSNPQSQIPQASATKPENGSSAPMAAMNQGMTAP